MENSYSNDDVSTFSKGPTADLAKFNQIIKVPSIVLDVGCGERRNSIFMAEKGNLVEAFDISEAGVNKAKRIALYRNLTINFWTQDLTEFRFEKEYEVILSHGVLHLPEKEVRDDFIKKAQTHTKTGGYNFIGIFTNRLPATQDNAPFTKSLFDIGELLKKYEGWEIIHHLEGTFSEEHPGGIKHEHAFERIVARKKCMGTK